MLFKNKSVKALAESYKRIWSIGQALGLMGWDLEVYMPENGANARANAESQLELLIQKYMLEMKKDLRMAKKEKSPNVYEQGFIRSTIRDIDYFTKIPPILIEKFSKATAKGHISWRHAREKSDFSKFKPDLELIVKLAREKAERLGYKKHPYNALLDLYEEEFTVAKADKMFGKMVPRLKKLTEKIYREEKVLRSHPLEKIAYKTEPMRQVNEKILKLFDMPNGRFRMDVSTHPFTMGINVNDVRITTRYEGTDFKRSVFSTIHEMGHAIYELNYDSRLEGTPLSDGASVGVHESQSRFWENIIGRSNAFAGLVTPLLKKELPFTRRYNKNDIYQYFNCVKPSLIRVDADEVTYNFHVYLRYEIEKKLINGDLEVSELPGYWNDMMEKLVGIRPKNDALGVLQDVHWSGGSFGYFPTYVVGNVIAGMTLQKMEKNMGSAALWGKVQKGQFNPIKTWLKDNIQKWGAVYTPNDLQMKVFGNSYNPDPFLSYLERKYLD